MDIGPKINSPRISNLEILLLDQFFYLMLRVRESAQNTILAQGFFMKCTLSSKHKISMDIGPKINSSRISNLDIILLDHFFIWSSESGKVSKSWFLRKHISRISRWNQLFQWFSLYPRVDLNSNDVRGWEFASLHPDTCRETVRNAKCLWNTQSLCLVDWKNPFNPLRTASLAYETTRL